MRRIDPKMIVIFLAFIGLGSASLQAAEVPGAKPAKGGFAHDFHVSITDIRYNPSAHSLEIAVKIFTDDLEAGLHGLGAPKLRLGTPREDASADSLLKRYLENRLQISVNGEKKAGDYLGKEFEADATWCYIEISNVASPQTMTIHNRILLEWFDDQSNLVHIEVEGEKRSLLLGKGHEEERVEF